MGILVKEKQNPLTAHTLNCMQVNQLHSRKHTAVNYFKNYSHNRRYRELPFSWRRSALVSRRRAIYSSLFATDEKAQTQEAYI